MVDSDLRFTTHIERVSKKMRAGIAVQARIGTSASRALSEELYYALIGSHIQYMIPMYGGLTAAQCNNIGVPTAEKSNEDLHESSSQKL